MSEKGQKTPEPRAYFSLKVMTRRLISRYLGRDFSVEISTTFLNKVVFSTVYL